MGTVELPLVGPNTTVEDALDQMKIVDASGVVLRRGNGLALLYARLLLEARDQQLRVVGDIEGGIEVVDPESARSFSDALDFIRPERSWPEYRNLFESRRVQHIMAPLRPRMAMVFAAGQSLASMPEWRGAGSIELPLVERHTMIEQALSFLRPVELPGVILPGVVVEDEAAGHLLYEPLLRESHQRGVQMIGGITGGWPLRFLPYADVARESLRISQPAAFNIFLSRFPSQQVMALAKPRIATLITAQEGIADSLRGYATFKCNGRKSDGRPHYFPNPSVREGDFCPKWPDCDVNNARTIVSRI